MKGTRLSRTNTNKQPSLAPLQSQCVDSLLKHPGFLKAVRGAQAEDAAIIAVNMAMEAMTQHVRRSPSVGGANACSMLSALIAVGDEVVLKPQTSGRGSPQNSAIVGIVIDNIGKGAPKPTYRVKWSTGEETTEAFDNLRMTKKAPPILDPVLRKCKLTPVVTTCSSNTRECVSDLARQLLSFEESLDWEYVNAERFRRMRSAWRTQLDKATSLKHLDACFRDFVKILHVEPEMSKLLTRVLDATTADEMRSLAEGQDYNAFLHLWAGLLNDLQAWLAAYKTKGSQGKQSYIFQTFESVYDRHGSPGFSKADMAISADDQAAIRKVLQDEEEFLAAKGMELRTVLLEGNDELAEDHMHGVTYGMHGLGGSYGGMPRTRSGVLQALLPGYVGEDDAQGDCSEATDFSDPCGWAVLPAASGDGEVTMSHHGSVAIHSATVAAAVPMEVG
eukprot:jgi/Ulvmu1/7267/UM035_0055.1